MSLHIGFVATYNTRKLLVMNGRLVARHYLLSVRRRRSPRCDCCRATARHCPLYNCARPASFAAPGCRDLLPCGVTGCCRLAALVSRARPTCCHVCSLQNRLLDLTPSPAQFSFFVDLCASSAWFAQIVMVALYRSLEEFDPHVALVVMEGVRWALRRRPAKAPVPGIAPAVGKGSMRGSPSFPAPFPLPAPQSPFLCSFQAVALLARRAPAVLPGQQQRVRVAHAGGEVPVLLPRPAAPPTFQWVERPTAQHSASTAPASCAS